MTPADYLELRRRVIDAGFASEIDWAQGLKPPVDVDTFADEYIWVVLNSGMRNQVARGIADKVYPALKAGRSASTAFGHKAKCRAIDMFWAFRHPLFASFLRCKTNDARFAFTEPKTLREMMKGTAPCIGAITRWHLAKNWGVDCAKPDRHLERIAEHYGTDTHALCARLSAETGDRVATVDLVLWRAANLQLIATRSLNAPPLPQLELDLAEGSSS